MGGEGLGKRDRGVRRKTARVNTGRSGKGVSKKRNGAGKRNLASKWQEGSV